MPMPSAAFSPLTTHDVDLELGAQRAQPFLERPPAGGAHDVGDEEDAQARAAAATARRGSRTGRPGSRRCCRRRRAYCAAPALVAADVGDASRASMIRPRRSLRPRARDRGRTFSIETTSEGADDGRSSISEPTALARRRPGHGSRRPCRRSASTRPFRRLRRRRACAAGRPTAGTTRGRSASRR